MFFMCACVRAGKKNVAGIEFVFPNYGQREVILK